MLGFILYPPLWMELTDGDNGSNLMPKVIEKGSSSVHEPVYYVKVESEFR